MNKRKVITISIAILLIVLLSSLLFFKPTTLIDDATNINIIRIRDENRNDYYISNEVKQQIEDSIYECLSTEKVVRTLSTDIRYPSDYEIFFEYNDETGHNVATIYIRNNNCYINSIGEKFLFKLMNPTSFINNVEFALSGNEKEIEHKENKTVISGEFTVAVRDVIPDYIYDNSTPQVAIVTEFQSYPFTIYVGKEIAAKLEKNKVYVFSIADTEVNFPLNEVKKMSLSSLAWEGIKITDVRIAKEDELGLASLQLTIKEK